MSETLSLKVKKELLENIKIKYQKASWDDKTRILDAFLVATNYQRKYAIYLLNKTNVTNNIQTKVTRILRYDQSVKGALLTIWHAANKICSKRLVPFLPEFINKLETHNYINLSSENRNKLLSISPSTIDRILKLEHKENKRNVSTTRCGSILKSK